MEMKQVVETSVCVVATTNSFFCCCGQICGVAIRIPGFYPSLSSIEIKIEKNEQNSIVHDKFSLIITQSQPSNNNNNDDDDNEWKN